MLEVFVFPVEEMVFFPTAAQPLHVFEPKYVRLVNDSIDTGTPIALTFLNPTRIGPSGRRDLVAGVGEPLICDKRTDGTLLILLRGLARVRLGLVRRFRPYIICEAELLPERKQVSDSNLFYLERLHKILSTWLEHAIPEAEYRQAVEAHLNEPETLVETYASHQVQDCDLKQALLEQSDINDRIRILSSYEAALNPARLELA